MGIAAFAIIALFIFLFGLVSERLNRSIVTPAMAFTAIGLVMSGDGLNLVQLRPDDELITIFAEITLVIILFTDASRIRLDLLRREYGLSLRMLSLGMPITILLPTRELPTRVNLSSYDFSDLEA